MPESPPCPFCGSADVIAVSRPELVRVGKPVYVNKPAYLCALGHMFSQSDVNKARETEQLRATG